ncbi:hypothetical protein DFH07DRAFT_817818 [Mycena maculata]|uniref:Uncharacterized protein n=1 Tax=Mycena maculata TaxID=230809 RepID=A0AAD7J8B3_9AGAR|nr:hypothetical protein DFH07DRAFT_817818 [Mycena maculata]
MDPLKISDLPAIARDWDGFRPNMKGYIVPQDLKLHPNCDDIESQIGEFTSTDYMRADDAPFLALSAAQNIPTTTLAIRGETFTVPLSLREIAYLTGTHLGNADTVAGNEVKFLNATSRKAISQTLATVLTNLQVPHMVIAQTTLVALDVLKGGSRQLSTSPVDTNHFATIFVIFPSLNPTDIRAYATHGVLTSDVKLPEDLTQSVSAIGMYAGVSDARITVGASDPIICLTYHVSAHPHSDHAIVPGLENLSGALQPLRDAFCLWRHRLNAGATAEKSPALKLFFLENAPAFAHEFAGDDATLLRHVAPLAKAYGFKVYIGQLVHTLSTEQEVSHPYKEYDNDIDIDSLEMDDHPEVDYKWENLLTLGGANAAEPDLLELATEMVQTDWRLQEDLFELDADEDWEGVDESLYSSTVNYTHVRNASVLFIAPM